jgi:hypothetical protein
MVALLILLLTSIPAPASPAAGAPATAEPASQAATRVRVNGQALTAEQIAALHQIYGHPPQPGDWWYDPVSGLLGPWGGPPMSQILPGHPLGVVPAEASGGLTGVSLNGRAVHPGELAWLRALLGGLEDGRYWLDAYGNLGVEGHPLALVNLLAVASARAQAAAQAQAAAAQALGRGAGGSGADARSDPDGSSFHHSDATGATVSSSGGSGYIMFDDGTGVSW